MTGMMAFGILISLKDMLSGPANKVVQSLKGIEKASNIGNALQAAGAQTSGLGALWAGVGDKIRGSIESIMSPAMQFEDSLAAVRTVAAGTFGSVEADVEAVTKAAREWSLVHKDTATSFAQASYMMISAGLDTRQAIAGTQTALAIATATMGDATEAASLLGSLYINLGDKSADVTREMSRLGDVVTRTQQFFKIANLGQLSEGLKYAVPVAKQFGISVEQVSTALGVLNTAGLEGSMAGTAFGAAMRTMIKASGELGFSIARTADHGVDFIGTIANIKAKFGDFQSMSDATKMKLQAAFGDEGLRAISVFMGATDDMKRALGEITASTGVTTTAQQTMEATGSAAIQILQNHFNDLKIAIAQDLGPAIRDIVETFKKVITTVKGFATAHPGLVAVAAKLAVIAAAALSVIGPIAALTGSFMTMVGGGIKVVACIAKLGVSFMSVLPAIWSFTAALLSSPLTWIILGVMALIAAIIALIVYWDKVVAAIKVAAGWLVEAFDAAWRWVKGLFTSAIAWLRENALLIGIILLGPVAWAVAAIVRYWEPLKGFFSDLWSGIKTIIVDAITSVIDVIATLPTHFFEAGQAMFNALWDGMKSIATSVVDWFRGTLETIRSYLPFSDAERGPLADLTRSGQALVETWAGGMQAAAPSLFGFLDQVGGQMMSALGGLMGFEVPEMAVAERAIASVSGGAAPGRSLTIQNLTIHVQAQDVGEQERFVDMLTRMAEQYG